MARKGHKQQHVADRQAVANENKARASRLRKATRPMTDRELIDEAIQQGKVTRCPVGWAYGSTKSEWDLK